MAEYIVDIILAVIFIAITVKYYVRGFAKTVLNCVAFVLSIALSGAFAGKVSDWFFSNTKLFAEIPPAVAKMIILVITFVVLSAALNWAVSLVNKVFKVPVIKQANKLLGALLGAVCGAIVVYVACVALDVAADVVYNAKFTGAIESSMIVGFVDTLV